MSASVSDLVVFEDHALARRWSDRKVPISRVYEAYIDGRINIPAANWQRFFDTRHDTMTFELTPSHFAWALTNLLPEVSIHSKEQDSRIVGEHYNRGNDFFQSFLGESMVYTSAWFEKPDVSLEAAQFAKIDRACRKLRLSKDETLLDIGCGWGTLVAHAARQFGMRSHGVTLAREQVSFGTDRIEAYGVKNLATVEVCDYRNIKGKYDKIVSLEMCEHVGSKNIVGYFSKVNELLADDGLFVLQWTGIRHLYSPRNPLSAITLRSEDLIWALFMARYIFPGADASLPLSGMLRAAESGGFEIVDVENMSPHYVLTLEAWRRNWESNEGYVTKSYGQRWFRLWYFFLSWSSLIGRQGSAFTYQVVMHKNKERFDRLDLRFDGRHFR